MRRVLVVHDSERYRGELARALAAAGFEVVACNSSATAMEILDGPHPIDLVVTPVGFQKPPSGAVLAMTARLKRRVPVIFVADPIMARLVPGIGRFILASATPAETVTAALRMLAR